ncbi:GAF domain-containing protein [Nocardia sp. alder85J]|uniref:GAF domain-containing protein n=1 Tax=Nocardia sp. alder85J TaxID=2862949 RepID=UPI001CD5FC1F|nr:GAF domain-containing protein [Nocardia sp. alder85J]MCX4092158.1 DUF5593 domain-containing protein [Nocardia sp. alder85J]
MRNSATPWITIETLLPGAMSVASVGETARNFAGWPRVLQRQLARTPAVYDSLSAADIGEAVWATRTRAATIDATIPTRSGPHVLRTRPVFGPAGDVHAVRLWVGAAGTGAPEPAAVGASWDLASQTIALPSGITRLSGIAATDYAPRISIAELFQQLSDFDRHAEVLDLLYAPEPGAALQFEADTAPGPQPRARWRITLRARPDLAGAWWLIEDIDPDAATPRRLALEWVGLREAHRRAGNYLAIVQLEHAGIAHWLTDPAPWIRWDRLPRPTDVFHPDDRRRLAELGDRIRAGDAAGTTVRVLTTTGDYLPTSVLVYPYPGYSARPLILAQFVRIADDLWPEMPSQRSAFLDWVPDSAVAGCCT